MHLIASYETTPGIKDSVLEKYIKFSFPKVKTMSSNDGTLSKVEVYELSTETVLDFLKMLAELSGTNDKLVIYPGKAESFLEDDPDGEDAILYTKSGNFKFSEWGIKSGDELVYKYNPKIKVRVQNNKQVLYNGKLYFLTQLADMLCKRPAKKRCALLYL